MVTILNVMCISILPCRVGFGLVHNPTDTNDNNLPQILKNVFGPAHEIKSWMHKHSTF